MEKFTIDYSTKNIPIPSQKDYLHRLIDKTEQFLRRMRWKAHFFLQPNQLQPAKESYGFKSTKNPPHIEDLEEFEDGMLQLIQSIKFKKINNPLLTKLSEDVKRIKNEKSLIVPADKTTNFYKLSPEQYDKLLQKNITKSYKKANDTTAQVIEAENKKIATNLNIDDRVEITANKDAFITLKDHKDNFDNNPACRLINPTKSEIGKISKKILDRVNNKIITATGINQWKSTSSVIEWFNLLDNKPKCSFICFDIVEFYPSISLNLLNRALDFAERYDTITSDERHTIIHAKSSLLNYKQQLWQKKSASTFDVTMGSYDGAETCELVGCFLLSQLQAKLGDKVGLYRDDGLAAINATPREIETIKKEICNIFTQQGLRITIEANKQIVNFLDVTLNLNDQSYHPYTKPGSSLLYIHRDSNHPPTVTKNIPEGINQRLSSLSSNAHSFNQSAPQYQKALTDSGYDHQLKYTPPTTSRRKNRQRNNIIWYNPPYSKSVSTNLGRKFLKLLDKCFPPGHKLRKILNKNTVKLSYSCMDSTMKIIDSHNKRILRAYQKTNNSNNGAFTDTTATKTCNCRKKDECPLSGSCLQPAVIYQAKVTRKDNNTTESYVGLTANEFKTRYRNHVASFRNARSRNSTELSKHIWSLKDNNVDYTITWSIIARAKPYNSASKRCNLCLLEKYIITCHRELCSLNKRNELTSSCRHRRKALLCNN